MRKVTRLRIVAFDYRLAFSCNLSLFSCVFDTCILCTRNWTYEGHENKSFQNKFQNTHTTTHTYQHWRFMRRQTKEVISLVQSGVMKRNRASSQVQRRLLTHLSMHIAQEGALAARCVKMCVKALKHPSGVYEIPRPYEKKTKGCPHTPQVTNNSCEMLFHFGKNFTRIISIGCYPPWAK